jgi:NADH-dependent peroxiredoxin subunit F
MYDLIVVGGGPAGLTAAVYAIRKRLNVLLVSKDLGGKTNYHLELPDLDTHQVIRGAEVVERFRGELEYLNFARHLEGVHRVTRRDHHYIVHTSGDAELPTKALIIATGARQQLLNVPGERDYLSRGLCYSAVSYAPLFIDKKTVVIGDGELALRSAAELATVAEHVTVVGPTGIALDTVLSRKLRDAANVTILPGHRVSRVIGNGFAKGVVVVDADGRETTVLADGTFVEMALLPNSELVADLVERDETGRIRVDNLNRTSEPGIFAAGDVTTCYAEQVLIAVGEGAKAALSAYDYLLPRL